MDDWPQPTWEPLWCSCKACSHWWDDWQPCMVPIATWVAHIKTIHCPACGANRRKVMLRTKPLDQKPGASDG